jgi:hypothetical protein
VPHLLLPAFRRSRRRLLRMLRASLAAGDFKGTAAGALLEGCGLRAELHPNVLLAVLWASQVGPPGRGLPPHSGAAALLPRLPPQPHHPLRAPRLPLHHPPQANSVAAMFWALAFLLLPENAAHLEAVRAEVRDAVAAEAVASEAPGARARGTRGGGAAAALPPALRSALARLALDRRSAVARCVDEAIRLRVHSVAIRLVPEHKSELVLTLPAAAAAGEEAAGGGAAAREPERAGVRARAQRGAEAAAAAEQEQEQPQKQQRQQQEGAGGDGGGGGSPREIRVPRGTVLAVCPFISHHDAALYPGPSPWEFNPDRPPIRLEPGVVMTSTAGFGFGGGFWRCGPPI